MEEKRNLRDHTLNKNVLIQLDSSTQLQMGQYVNAVCQRDAIAMQDTKQGRYRSPGPAGAYTNTEHVNLLISDCYRIEIQLRS